MFATLFFATLFLALFKSAVAQGSSFTIDTPALVQCQATQITWSDSGYPPYDLLVVSAEDICGDALEDLGNQTSTSVIWTVNIAAGTDIVLSLLDTGGNEAWSGSITVGNSNDTSCLNGTNTPPSTYSSSPPPFSSTTPPISVTPTSTTPSHPSSSAFSPAGAANAGLFPNSGVHSRRPFSATTLVGSALLAVVAFAL